MKSSTGDLVYTSVKVAYQLFHCVERIARRIRQRLLLVLTVIKVKAKGERS